MICKSGAFSVILYMAAQIDRAVYGKRMIGGDVTHFIQHRHGRGGQHLVSGNAVLFGIGTDRSGDLAGK